jgi:hypothetical protein
MGHPAEITDFCHVVERLHKWVPDVLNLEPANNEKSDIERQSAG